MYSLMHNAIPIRPIASQNVHVLWFSEPRVLCAPLRQREALRLAVAAQVGQ